MNVLALNRQLCGNTDAVMTILESIDIENVKVNSERCELRFARESGSNPSSCKLNIDTLSYFCFSNQEHGDIYTLVMEKKGVDFPRALRFVAETLRLDTNALRGRPRVPFDGFYKQFSRSKTEDTPLQTYSRALLEPYADRYSLLFLRDGIGFDTQALFQVGYDMETARITIPTWTIEGELCGIMGRLNDPYCNKEDRWLPILPCSRSKTVFGFHMNYSAIKQAGLAIIGESEKFVMQLHSMGSEIGLATCGCGISTAQARYIKSLMVPRLILAFDEGLEEDYLLEQAAKLKSSNTLYHNQVGYIYDHQNEILPEGSKSAPSDLGRRAFADLTRKHVRWI